MKESNMPKADFVTSLVLMAFGAFVAIASMQMPDFVDRGASPYAAPGVVSGLVGFAILALCPYPVFSRRVWRGLVRFRTFPPEPTGDRAQRWLQLPIMQLGPTSGRLVVDKTIP